jgi:hypothetical protein
VSVDAACTKPRRDLAHVERELEEVREALREHPLDEALRLVEHELLDLRAAIEARLVLLAA